MRIGIFGPWILTLALFWTGIFYFVDHHLQEVSTSLQVTANSLSKSKLAKSTITTQTPLELFLQHWVQDWQSGKIEDYMQLYSPSFHSGSLNFAQWMANKIRLRTKSRFVKIDLGNPLIFSEDAHSLSVKFMQSYRSNVYSDFGEKTLRLEKTYHEKTNYFYLILEEHWKPFLNQKPAMNLR